MRDKLDKLSNWLSNNDLEEESSAVSKILSKYAKENEEGEESDDESSGEYWDFSIDNVPSGWSSSNFSPEDILYENLSLSTLIWKEGMSDWIPAKEVDDISKQLKY